MSRTISERVDALLKHGVSGIKKWAIKHTYVEPTPYPASADAWEVEWRALREHHLEETEFFLNVIDELRTRLLETQNDTEKRTDD
jgi:hypothetical protein